MIKYVFILNSNKRFKNESLRDKKISLNKNISDVFIDILEIIEGERIITFDEMNNIKHNLDEEELYDLKEYLNDDDENEINNKSQIIGHISLSLIMKENIEIEILI